MLMYSPMDRLRRRACQQAKSVHKRPSYEICTVHSFIYSINYFPPTNFWHQKTVRVFFFFFFKLANDPSLVPCSPTESNSTQPTGLMIVF